MPKYAIKVNAKDFVMGKYGYNQWLEVSIYMEAFSNVISDTLNMNQSDIFVSSFHDYEYFKIPWYNVKIQGGIYNNFHHKIGTTK